MENDLFSRQMALCAKYGARYLSTPFDGIVGVALDVHEGRLPINGLRLSPAGGASGWYIWAGGEPSTADDCFKPVHASHIEEWCPQILKFLGLSPGWRFLVAHEYEDVWFDPSVLDGPD